jgi:hypothetical protein
MYDPTFDALATVVMLRLDVLGSLVEGWVLREYPCSVVVDEDDGGVWLFLF